MEINYRRDQVVRHRSRTLYSENCRSMICLTFREFIFIPLKVGLGKEGGGVFELILPSASTRFILRTKKMLFFL